MQELKNYFEKLNTQNWEKFEDFYELSCPGDTIFCETSNVAPFLNTKIIVITLP